ncbi:MAG: cation:proton antiporter [Candidatus Diapherotrites archaeon]|nr:cation:proton antiporter [Candidatus Diapherotrites archaeon]
MALNVLSILTLIALTIILGYIGAIIFKKTGIPDVLWLMLFGVLVGPTFRLINTELFVLATPLFAAIALIIILFQGGLSLKLNELLKEFVNSTKLSLVNLLLSILLVSTSLIFIFQLDPIKAFLVGAIVSGTSAAVVLSIVNRIQANEKIKTMLSLESIITDPFTIVIVVAVIGLLIPMTGNSPWAVIASAFSIGTVLGLFFGLIWLMIMPKLTDHSLTYMITLALILFLYVTTELLSGSGAIAALVFGITLANRTIFAGLTGFKEELFPKNLLDFQEEVTFFIRSFFFVNLGLIFVIKPEFILMGITVTAVILIARYIGTNISMSKTGLTENGIQLIWFMGPRGLAAAVMSQLPATYGLPNSELFASIAFIVIFLTILFTTITIKFFYKPEIENSQQVL